MYAFVEKKMIPWKKYFFLGLFMVTTQTYSHSGYWGVTSTVDSVMTKKGFGAISLQGLLLLSWIDVGFEINAVTNSENYNPSIQNAANAIIGFNIYGVIYANYITSKHWQVGLNIPVKFLKFDALNNNEPVKFLGVMIAADLPNVADIEYRYRFGVSFNIIGGPGAGVFP